MNNTGEYFSNNKDSIKSILSNHGYQYIEHSNYLSCGANYRNVPDTQSVVIYYDDNKFIDFASGLKGTIKDFLQLVTEQKSAEELEKYLKENNVELNINPEPKLIKQQKKFDPSLLNYLLPDHSYPISRGISEETCKLFEGGKVDISVKGKLKNRYTWPIRNSKNEIVGFSGRSLDSKIDDKYKYLHFGDKNTWVWPVYLNAQYVMNTKCAVLTESNMCILTLWDNGIKNEICLFGTELSLAVLNFLLKCNVEKIVIATNNEPNNNNIGNQAALKIKTKLSRYFDSKNIIIHLPYKKDFNDMGKDEIKDWWNKLKLMIGDKYFKYD